MSISKIKLHNLDYKFVRGLKTAFIWPGQGAQFIGMLDHLKHLKWYDEVISTAHQALNDEVPLETIMDNGPENVLNLTRNVGPAMLIYC
jgi:malonyl CoA-acyl carrier protein transacylase